MNCQDPQVRIFYASKRMPHTGAPLHQGSTHRQAQAAGGGSGHGSVGGQQDQQQQGGSAADSEAAAASQHGNLML